MLKKMIFAFILILYLIPTSAIDAHSLIEKRSPEINAIFETAPQKVELTFEEPVEIHRSSIIVRNEKEVEVQIGRPQLDPNDNRHILIDLEKNLPSGKYSVQIDVSPKEAEQGIYPKSQIQQGVEAKVEITPFIAGPNDIIIHLSDETNMTKVRVKFSTSSGWSVENTAFCYDS